MSESSLKPTPKIAAAGVGSAAAILLIAAAKIVHVDLPLEVALAIVAVAPPLAGYLKRDKRHTAPAVTPPA